MRTTIEKVRAAVVVGAGLVALIVAGFLLLAHYRSHRLLRNLPARLGADIQKETNGYTYSQSVKGRTVFTLHAAKATQHRDGRTGLEDVGIVLYGQKDGRADRIYGKQFEYDQKHGIVRAMGEVQLDLQAPAPASAAGRAEYARGGEAEQTSAKKTDDAQPIHVVTSGLVYVQELGVASTEQPIHFSYRGMTGQAKGAAYNSDTGVTTLESEVRISALREGRPTALTAAHAELDRVNHRMTLETARYVVLADGSSDRALSEGVTAGRLVVHLGEGGGIEGAEGSGGVEVASGGSRMEAPEGVLHVTAEGRPELAEMTGGVRFASEQMTAGGGGESIEGTAAASMAHFDGRGVVEAVQLSGGVRASSGDGGPQAFRTLSGDEVDLRLAGEAGASRRWVQQATIRGDARVQSALPAAAGHTASTEEMRAEILVARWQLAGREPALREVTGDGRTEIRRSRDGVEEVSRGRTLEATFGTAAETKDAHASGQPGSGPGRLGVMAATQSGDVVMERTTKTAAKTATGAVETTRARAQRAVYEADATGGRDAADGSVTLSGGAEIAEAESTLRADQVRLSESTGDAEATGSVQVTYRQTAADRAGKRHADAMQEGGSPATQAREDVRSGALPERIHAVAARAMLRKQTGVATFFGTPALRARLWQGGSQVEAPVLVFARREATLDAYAADAGERAPVRTVLVSRAGANPIAAKGLAEKPQVLRVQSGRLHYVDASRLAEFKGGVELEDANGTMRSREAVAMLSPVGGKKRDGEGPVKAVSFGGLSGGGLERVTATGDVVIEQPGRVATGQHAVYSAADGVFVLTGDGGVLPKVTDDASGSVTGAVLRFKSGNGSGDNSVMVEGRLKNEAGGAKGETAATGDGRVHTQTRVKQ